jgi:hypothetical protein
MDEEQGRITEAICRLRERVRWRPGKDTQHLAKRIELGQLPVGTTIDGEAHLSQGPRIAWPGVPPTPRIGLLLRELPTPLPAGFVGHEAPTGEPPLCDIPIPAANAAVQPDASTDELSRAAVGV